MYRTCQYLRMLPVSLLVRLWVEMHFFISQKNHSFVSLLVRLWVEISKNSHIDTPFTSASLWGCELKYNLYHGCCLDDLSASLWGCELKCQSWHHKCHPVPRQPPCEAVSWNTGWWSASGGSLCQPPCEAVSWNKYVSGIIAAKFTSASLWGCELKCHHVPSWYDVKESASLWGCELK